MKSDLLLLTERHAVGWWCERRRKSGVNGAFASTYGRCEIHNSKNVVRVHGANDIEDARDIILREIDVKRTSVPDGFM